MNTLRRVIAVFLAAFGASALSLWWYRPSDPLVVFLGILFVGLAVVVWPFKRD